MNTKIENCIGTPFIPAPAAERRVMLAWFARRAGYDHGTGSVLERVIVTIFKWQERARQREALYALTARELQDIGISRADAETEARKPFWKP